MTKLIKVKIKIGDLFEKLNLNNDKYEKVQEISTKIYIKTPQNEIVPVLGYVKKKVNLHKYTFDNNQTLICSDKHIVLNENFDNILISKATKIQTLNGEITKINDEDLGEGNAYDISIKAPHLYFTANGIIHHNTTTAKALVNQFGHPYLYINASVDTGIDIIRNRITDFCTTRSLTGDNSKLKIVILDEVDGVSDAFFKGLRASMDQFAKNTRFIATCNYINKIPEPIQSRFEVIDFNFTKIEETEIKKEYIKRILQICKAEGISIDKYAAVEIVKRKFPDLRSILNMLQGYKNEGLDEITVDNIKQHASVYKDVYDLIFDNSDPVKNYQYLVSNYSNKVDDILAALGTEFINYIITDKEEYQKYIPQISILVAKYQSQRNTVIDEVITLLACVYEIQTTIA